MEEPRDQLPPLADFYDVLREKVTVTEEEHAKACDDYLVLGCKSLKDYMMHYLKLDVFLLADVFETFRETSISENALDPIHFFGVPGLSWASALKSLNKPLELIQNQVMYEFFESGIRGGITFVNQHYAEAAENQQLLYIDMYNFLYIYFKKQFIWLRTQQ